MAGISSKAAGSLVNKEKFVGQEFNTDFDVNLYEFAFRSHDPQIGTFIQVDPLADKYVYNSTYAYAENRVINSYDLEGLEAKLAIAGVGHEDTHYSSSDINAFNARAQKLEKIGFEASQAQNGDQIVSQMVQATKSEGSIGGMVIFAHSSGFGIFLDNNEGFYTAGRGDATNASANVNDVKAKVDAGEIKFAEGAAIVFGSCRTCNNEMSKPSDPLAVSMTKELQVTTYGATGAVYPEVVNGKETGRLKTDGTFIMNTPVVTTTTTYKTVTTYISNGGAMGGLPVPIPITTKVPVTTTTVTVQQTDVGKVIDPAKIFPQQQQK